MTLLPFNFTRLGTLREAMLWRLLALPLLCAVMVWPIIDVQACVDILAPVVEPIAPRLATPAIKIAEFIVAMTGMCAAAMTYALGWLLNFAVLAAFRRHSSATLLSAFAGVAIPPCWERKDASARVRSAQLKNEADWRFAREIGPLRYIVVRGGLLFGTVAFVGLHIVLNLIQSPPIVIASLPLKYALWVLFGLLLTAPRWWALKCVSGGEA